MRSEIEIDLALVFISPDLRTIRHVTYRASVMYLGDRLEVGPTDAEFELLHHPSTTPLGQSVPTVSTGDRSHIRLDGQLPVPANPPSACGFHVRCPVARDGCSAVDPIQRQVGKGQRHRCHFGTVDLASDHVAEPSERVRDHRAGDGGPL